MTMSIAPMPMTTAMPAFARASASRAADAMPVRAEATDGAAESVSETPGSAAPADSACQVSDPAPAFGTANASSPAFADVIADLADESRTSVATPSVQATDEGTDHETDRSTDAASTAFAAAPLLPGVQAALGLAAKVVPASLPAGEAGSVESADCRRQVGEPTPMAGRGAPRVDVPVEAMAGTPAAAARAATDIAPPVAGLRQRAEEASAGAPPAAGPAPAAVAALAVPDTTASFSRLAGADVLALRGAEPAQWRPALKAALGERLHVQVGARSEQAVIRLDPPQLGRIEIVVRHEGGHLQVHLAASNGDVLRQLHTLTEGLRQDLVHRHHGEVAVSVSELAREGGGSGRREREAAEGREQTPGRALAEAEGGTGHDAFVHPQDLE